MPRLTVRIPKYRLHRPSGRAVVTIGGRDIYLGKHGSEESKARYNQLIGEWKVRGLQVPPPAAATAIGTITVDDVILAYLSHVKTYYVKNGRPTSTQVEVRRFLGPFHELFGGLAATDFGPLRMKVFQDHLIAKGWCRNTINKAVGYIKRMFKWAAAHELTGIKVHQRLQTVCGLRRGRSAAPESAPVSPVPEDLLEAVLRCAPQTVAAMIQVQRYTGMRPNEVTSMRLCDLDRSGEVWVYTPASHKTEHHGRIRKIFIGPKAQRVLLPFLRTEPEAYLFSPAAAEAKRRKKQHALRRTPMSCGNRPGTNRKKVPKRSPGDRYTTLSYGCAITRVCEKAFPPPDHLAKQRVPGIKGERWETCTEWRKRLGKKQWQELRAWRKAHHWSPNQLRHNAATELRKQFGIEAARVVLGHTSAVVTEIYAEMDFAKAEQIMAEAG